MKDDALIDLAKGWIEERDGAYLAKENQIVYYTSHSGRKSDFVWVSLTVPEVIRIITATLLNPADSGALQHKHVLAAAQESDRVFEFGIRSQHESKKTVFNYTRQAHQDMGDLMMQTLAFEMDASGYRAFLYMEAKSVYFAIEEEMKTRTPDRVVTSLMHKHFTAVGYVVRVEQHRPEHKGKKKPAIMMPGTRPRQIVELTDEMKATVVRKVVTALK